MNKFRFTWCSRSCKFQEALFYFCSNSTPLLQQHKKPKGHWNKLLNQRQFFDELGKKLNITKPEDWLSVKKKEINDHGGYGILYHYSNVQQALEKIYPETDWNSLIPHRFPLGYWDDTENQRKYLDSIQKELKVTSPKELVKLKRADLFIGRTSIPFLSRYPNFYEAIVNIYPEYQWNISDYKYLPKNGWKSKEIQKKFLEEYAKQFKIQSMNDWYKVSVRHVKEQGGSGLLNQYPTFFDLLCTLYPSHPWDPHKFQSLPRNFWGKQENVIKFLNKVIEKHNIKSDSDWERISGVQLVQLGGGGILDRYHSLFNILSFAFPDVKWNKQNFKNKKKQSMQRWLFLQVKKLFPAYEIIENYLHEPLSRISGKSIELDVFIPELNYAFEYNGHHHYKELPNFGSLELYQARDREKIDLCNSANIFLVVVPYWWDGEMESLEKFINDRKFLAPLGKFNHF